MSLSEAHELVGDFTDMIVEEREPSRIWPFLLQRLQQVIGFDAGYIAASWSTAMEGRGAILEHDEPFMKRNLGRFLAEITPAEIACYADRARNHDSIWPALRRKQLAVFNEVLEPSGMKQMLVRVSVRHGNIAGFNLERKGCSTAFSERDLALVDMVAPLLHIVEVLTLETADEVRTDDFAQRHDLSRREKEFVDLTIRGLQNGEIAMLLGISANTVRNTLARVFEKVGASNRAELTYLATRPAHEPESSRQGWAPSRPPASKVPDDGLPTFTQRVQEVSTLKQSSASRPAVSPVPYIVYTPPVTGVLG